MGKLEEMKTKRLVMLIVGAVSLLTASVSCTKMDRLSDENSLKSFKVTAHLPKNIELGVAQLSAAESVIYIPVTFGADQFPLNFSVEVEYSGRIDRIVGADLSGELTLESIDDRISFTVLAISGMPRKYTIVPIEVEYVAPEELMMIVKEVNPSATVVFPKVRIENDYMNVFVANASFPLIITPEFIYDETVMELEAFTNGVSKFTFETAASRNRIVIRDKQAGSKRDVKVQLVVLPNAAGDQDGSSSLDLEISDFKPVYEGEDGDNFMGYRINSVRDSITLIVKDLSSMEFPATFSVTLGDFGDDAGFPGLENPMQMTFDSAEYVYKFIAMDINAAVSREWSVYLAEWVEPGEAEVLGFTFGYEASQTGLNSNLSKKYACALSGCEVFPSGDIYINMTSHNTMTNLETLMYKWKLTLKNMAPVLSPGATSDIPSEYLYEGVDSWQGSRQFTVTSRDGETKTWTIHIKDVRDYVPSSEKELLEASVKGIMPITALVDADPIAIDQEEKKIQVRLAEDEDCYPLSVSMSYVVSDFARVTSQNNNSEPLVFDAPESTATVTITAEDGSTQDWTASLIQPVRTSGANVTGFRASFPSGFHSTGSVIMTEAGELGDEGIIYMKLDAHGSVPVTVSYNMGLSRGARSSVAEKGTYVFDKLSDEMKFEVTGSDGSRKNWTLKFEDYKPQLQNGNMENWTSDNLFPTPKGLKGSPYWSNANMKVGLTVENTTKTNGAAGQGYAAQLKSNTVAGNFAAGNLFVGWFDLSDPLGMKDDPVTMTYQGIPWASTHTIRGIEVDISYHPGKGAGSDTGSVAVELVKQDDLSKEYIYHGKRPNGVAPSDNNAVMVARARALLGTQAGTQNGETIRVVPDDTWTTIQVLFDNQTVNPAYTHLVVTCASSSRGDEFKGENNSVLKLDNFRILYNE